MTTYTIRNFYNTETIGTITRESPPPLGLVILDARNNRYYNLSAADRTTTPITYFATACQKPRLIDTLD